MSEQPGDDYVRPDLATIPVYVWVLALVVLLLAAVACGLWAVYSLRLHQPLSGPSPTPIIWTATPGPTMQSTSTPTEAAVSTPTLSPDIAIGRYVMVTGTAGAGVSLRQQPDVNSPRISVDIAVGVGYEGEVFIVVDGPRQVEGYTWWLLRDPDNEAREGWAVGNYLEPVEHP